MSRPFDAHLHLTAAWPGLPATGHGPALDFSLAGLLAEMRSAGVAGGLLLPLGIDPEADPACAEAEARAIVGASGGRLAAVGTVDPTQGRHAVDDALGRWRRWPMMAGIKLYPGYRAFFPSDERLAPVYDFAAAGGLPVLLHQGDTLVPDGVLRFARPVEVDEVAVAHRGVRFVLCHMGNPWMEEAAELVRKNPNVYADMSGLLAPGPGPGFSRARLRAAERVRHAVDSIGSVQRLLFGSDWPVESYTTAIGLLDGLDLDVVDRERLAVGTARELFSRGFPDGFPA